MARSKYLITALALAASAAPQMAQASCNGAACTSFSAIATWSSSDKRVNAVLTNKDPAKEMKVKLCITVDSKCNNFEVTLPPRGSTTKSVSVSGGAAPPKFAVEANSADFTVVQGATPAPSSTSTTTTGSTGASGASGMDVGHFGKFTY